MKPDDAWKRECLEDYVRAHMNAKEFADHVGVSRSTAYQILQGRRWTRVPRPEGFQHPWPDNRSPSVLHERRRKAYEEGYRRFVEEDWSYRRLSRHLGIPLQTTWDMVQRLRKTNTYVEKEVL